MDIFPRDALKKFKMVGAGMGLSALLITGCTTTQGVMGDDSLADKDTGSLCRIASHNSDAVMRGKAVALLVKRHVTEERCVKIMENDQGMLSMALGIPVGTISDAVRGDNNVNGYAWNVGKTQN